MAQATNTHEIAERGNEEGVARPSQIAPLIPSSTPAHRLPTLTAAEAMEQAAGAAEHGKDAISLGIGAGRLDMLFAGKRGESVGTVSRGGGVKRGVVTEVYGPPGVGKTAICIQAAAEALRSGETVVWIDTAAVLPARRLEQVLSSSIPSELTTTSEKQSSSAAPSTKDQLSRLSHYVAPTLAHLLALVSHAPASFPPVNTSLLIVDSVSTPVDGAYPRRVELRNSSGKNEQAKWLAGRRQAVIAEVGSKLASMAAMRNIALLVTTNTVTKVRVGEEALLKPAISGADWDAAIGIRVALFRDWVTDGERNGDRKSQGSARFAEVIKPGIAADDSLARNSVAFHIEQDGVHAKAELAPPAPENPAKNERAKKRPRDEIGSSDAGESSSEYGWSEADDELAADGLVDASFV